MMKHRRRLGRLGGLVVTASTWSAGCLSFCHPCYPPPRDQVRACCMMPPCCRNHVYVFFVNGVDPLCYANFAGLRDYVHALGFIKTYYGQFYHEAALAEEVRHVHAADPLAHVVIIGLDQGVNRATDLAETVQAEGIFVDLLVIVGEDRPHIRSDNLGRVVVLQSTDEGDRQALRARIDRRRIRRADRHHDASIRGTHTPAHDAARRCGVRRVGFPEVACAGR